MGESSSSLHEWEKPVFPWEQSMPSLFCSFVLWGTVMMSGWFRMASTPLLRSLLFSPSPVCPLCGRKPGNECYPTRGGTVKGHLGSSEENGGDLTQWIFIWALARGVCVCVFISMLDGHFHYFSSSNFSFLMPLMRHIVCSGSGKNIWLHESHSPCEYWTIQLKDPALSRGWHWAYWLGWDAQDAETWESCLIFHWVGINLAIYCFSTFLLLSHRTIIIFFQWRMTSITLKINCSIVWKYLSWISLALVRAEHPQPRKGGRAVPALNSALQMSVTCF